MTEAHATCIKPRLSGLYAETLSTGLRRTKSFDSMGRPRPFVPKDRRSADARGLDCRRRCASDLLNRFVQVPSDGRPFEYGEYAIADRESGRFVSSPFDQTAWPDGDNGILVEGCRSALFLRRSSWLRGLPRCWNLPYGEVMPLPARLRDYKIAQGTLASSRVVAERWGTSSWIHELSEYRPDLLRVKVVNFAARRKSSR
jgi:hypothetical protein